MHLGIDIGGTKILCLAISSRGKVLGRGKKKVKDPSPEEVVDRAWQTAREALEDAGAGIGAVSAVGMAVPSAVSEGVAVFAPALGWRDVPVANLARRRFKRRVVIGNDVNLGLLAEHQLGAARGGETAAGFFIGTGVGGAVLHRGQLIEGQGGMAGEVGHVVVEPGGRRCGCGKRGCLEAYASKAAFLARLKRAIYVEGRSSLLQQEIRRSTRVVLSRQLRAAYRAGDPLTREVVDEGLSYLGLAAANLINVLAPSHVVLGGGVAEAFGPPLLKKVRASAAPHLFGGRQRAEVIVLSALGDDAVPLGAALQARAAGRS